MRFYDIIIKDKKGNVRQSPSLSGAATANFRSAGLFGIDLGRSQGASSAGTKQKSSYTSFVNGQSLPGALQISLNITGYTPANPGSGYIDIWGVSKEEISMSYSLVGSDILVYAGMRKGLPLAKPYQSQMPIANGKIIQCYGNWQGTEQILHMDIIPSGVGRASDSSNFVFDLKANGSIKEAILTTMGRAMPSAKTFVYVSDKVKFDTPMKGVYPSLQTFSMMLVQLTSGRTAFQGIKTVTGQKYAGIQCFVNAAGNGVMFTDHTIQTKGGKEATSTDPVVIEFSDIVGQPTWQDIAVLNFKTIMRSDILIGDRVKIPEAVAAFAVLNPKAAPTTILNQSLTFPSREKSTFTGEFIISSVRHTGNFRGGSGNDWVTNFTALVPEQKKQEEEIPAGTVIVGQPTKAPDQKPPDKIAPQQSTLTNLSPPDVPGILESTSPFTPQPTITQTEPSTGAPLPNNSPLDFVFRR